MILAWKFHPMFYDLAVLDRKGNNKFFGKSLVACFLDFWITFHIGLLEIERNLKRTMTFSDPFDS